MTKRKIVIGDVHGHYYPLLKLLEAIAPGDEDQVYFLGDLIDRGPKSAEVVKLVMTNNFNCLRGNHEEMLLSAIDVDSGEVNEKLYQAWLHSGGDSTVASYRGEIPIEHLQWINNLPSHLDLGDYWLAHAGINPNLPLEEQTEAEFCWIREEFHSTTKPYFENKTIITGHTITFTLPGVFPGKIAKGPGWLGIDTGVYHKSSGWLTAVDITEDNVYQINSRFRRVRQTSLEQATTEINPTRILDKGVCLSR